MEKLFDFKQLEELAAGNPDFMLALARIYLSTIPDNSKEMVEATEKEDWSKVSKLAHKLKSTIDSMNMATIQKDIRVLENDAKNKANVQALPPLATKVNSVIHRVAEQLRGQFML